MRIGAIMAITMAMFLGAGPTGTNAQAPAGSAEAASAPQAASGKASTDQTTAAAPVTRPSSTEKSQAAVTDSRLAPRSPNAPN